MRANPHVLEINAHAWFKRIKKEFGPQVKTLADVPQSVLLKIKELGFDAVWLMGVWQESMASRQIAREDAGINQAIKQVVTDYSKEDIIGSQYSIYGYEVNEVFGGESALLTFKENLNNLDINLFLDFAANHLAKDHPQTLLHPEYFVRSQSDPQDKNLFFQTKNGEWLAHGRDPHFPPWSDTVQINHFNPAARQFLLSELLKVAKMCDGLRCDMVMLMMKKVFRETWGKYITESSPEEEFWPLAINKVRSEHPGFIFGAEVYWGLEWEVQEMGFDYTYDKILYDRLLLSNAQDIAGHLNAEHLYQKRSIRFISNHDEESPITAFGPEKSKAAAVVVSTITGSRLYTLSQIFGEKRRLPIQYVPNSCDIDPAVLAFYKKLFAITNHPCFHGGQWALKTPRPASDNDDTYKNFLAWSWTQQNTCKAVVINYSGARSRCFVPISKSPAGDTLTVREEFSQTTTTAPTAETKSKGFYLELAPYEAKILSLDF
ncbi:MAG: hypothetical protein LBM71_05825 [Elusimicrobiota bacterium]|jgi:hypothetical protein|nr:hypothetical protein [Elusimicrobiota bacterium]